MKPQLVAASFAAALAGMSSPLHAGPLDRSEIAATAYVSLAFGGVSRKQVSPILGFALNQTRREPTDGFSSSLLQPSSADTLRSLLDIRYDLQKRNWAGFRIGGVDALSYTTRMKVDGTTETVATLAEIPTAAIVAGVVLGAAAIHDATKKDDPPAPKPATFTCPPGTVLLFGTCV